MKRFYSDGTSDLCPPYNMPVDMKSGNIFKSLLMGPFIGMPTVLIEKKCFLASGGFDEPLVYVYDTSNSLNKNEISKFEIQMLMIEKYLPFYVQFQLLNAKLGATLSRAMELNSVPLFQEYLKKIELIL